MRYGQVCLNCANFARRNQQAAKCGSCGRHQLLKKGYCRLCWCQARLERPPAQPPLYKHQKLLPYVRQVRFHQLFFAGMPGPKDLAVTLGDAGARSPHATSGQVPAGVRPRSRWVQLMLVTDVRRHYRFGRVNLNTQPVPDNPWLAWALHIAGTMAQARGWDTAMLQFANRVLVVLLADYAEGETIRVSDFKATLRQHCASIKRATEILTAMGIVCDDRPAVFDGWLAAQLDGTAPGIAADAGRWARALHQGTPRTRALTDKSVRIYLAAARPALLDWSARYGHLREITRDDVRAQITALHGEQRKTTLTALRSLFAWAKKNGVVFHDPASRLSAGHDPDRIYQALTAEQITQAVNAATTPHTRLAVALAAIHAARPGAIRAMQLSDVDVGNRRLTIAGRTRPLDELTRRLLQDWLACRQQRWPSTANPHLLVNAQTAPGTGPVSQEWLTRPVRKLPATLERLRTDRQLEEALTHDADPLHLATVFGIDTRTAMRYAHSARQLLTQPAETESASSPRTQRLAATYQPLNPRVTAENPSVRLNSRVSGRLSTRSGACG